MKIKTKLILILITGTYLFWNACEAQKTWEEYYLDGVDQYVAGDYYNAIESFSKSIEIKPAVYSFEMRALAYSIINRDDDAIKDFNQAIKADTIAWNILCYRSWIKTLMKDDKAALDFASRAIQIAPNKTRPLTIRGEIYLKMCNFELSIKDYTSAIKIDSLDGSFYYNRGLAFSGIGQDDKAEKDYSIALRLGFKNPAVYYHRGISRLKLDKDHEALPDLTEALRLFGSKDSISSNINDNIGWALIDTGLPDSAIVFFNKSLEMKTGNIDACIGRALACYLLNDMTHAEESIDQAVKYLPGLATSGDPILLLEKQGYFYSSKDKTDIRAMLARARSRH